jgi:hypothetical protein
MAKKVLTISIIVIVVIVAIFILWSFMRPSVTYVGDQNTNANNQISNQQETNPEPTPTKKLQTQFNVESCIFCEHVSISEDVATIDLDKLESVDITSVFVSFTNEGETSLGDINSGVVCSQPKYNLIPNSKMACWPGLEEGCYLGENNLTVTLSPGKGAVAVFSWDMDKLKQLTASDSLTCQLSVGSPQTSESYSKSITFNFVK